MKKDHHNGKRPGEYTPRRAARLLGVHLETIYRWCHDCVDGNPSKLKAVRRSITGRFYIPAQEVDDMIEAHYKGRNGCLF